jgi:hypothetical protein
MDTIVSHLDVTKIFCEVDDFCQQFERHWQHQRQLPSMPGEKRSRSRLHLSEVMTIAIAFHGSGARTFKDFYTLTVLPHWHACVSQSRQLHPLFGVDAMVLDAVVLLCAHPQG